jgi:H+-translocating diphosphatase
MLTCNNIIQDYKEKPDYGRCVAIVASASLREMIKPGALAIISPMAVGESCRPCLW